MMTLRQIRICRSVATCPGYFTDVITDVLKLCTPVSYYRYIMCYDNRQFLPFKRQFTKWSNTLKLVNVKG